MSGVVQSVRQKFAALGLARRIHRDDVRVPLQTVVAVILAYVVSRFAQISDISWAVFSALFVVQASLGGTLGSAMDRVFGALVGAMLGSGLVWLMVQFELPPSIPLVVGVGAMSLISVYRPALSYGLVTVTILTVTPELQMFEGALAKVWAIALGSLSAALAGAVVLPVSSRKRANQDLADTVLAMNELLEGCTERLLDCGKEQDFTLTHGRIDRALDDVQATLWQSRERFDWRPKKHAPRHSHNEKLKRLRYTIATLERLGWAPLPAAACDALGAPLRAITQAATTTLAQIAASLAVGREIEAPHPLADELRALEAASGDVIAWDAALTTAERDQIGAINWAWRTMDRQICQLAGETKPDSALT